jgi:preprotein translocase subunit SecE
MANESQESSTTASGTKEKGPSTMESNKPTKAAVAKRGNVFTESAQFLRDVAIEHRKITWPDRAQIIRETWSVLVLVACITLVVLAFDWVLGQAIFGPLEHLARLYGPGRG